MTKFIKKDEKMADFCGYKMVLLWVQNGTFVGTKMRFVGTKMRFVGTKILGSFRVKSSKNWSKRSKSKIYLTFYSIFG
jgi:hypothetical protein